MIGVGSDFSGVGAFDQALIRLGIKYNTVFACDMDKYARQTYVHNYGEPDYFPMDVYDREIPTDPLDIYMTSPPCQAFSLAGKRKGEDDKRGILFYNSHEFIQKNKPRYFIFENVKGLLSDDSGKTFRRWVEYLGGKSINGNPVIFPHGESVPYHIYWKVLNAKNYGIPQNRERVFIVGIRDDVDNDFTWPKEQFLEKRLKDVLEENVDEKYFLSEKMVDYLVRNQGNRALPFVDDNKEVSNCIVSVYHKTPTDGQYIKVNVVGNLPGKHEQNSRVYSANGVSPSLTTMQGGGQEPKIALKINQNETGKILRLLREEIEEKEIRTWGLRILETIREEEVLRQGVHEESLFGEGEETAIGNRYRIQQGKSKEEIADVLMRSMPEETWERCSPQRRESIKQLIEELNESLQVMSHENPQAESSLQSGELRNESEGIRVLREALSEVQKVWKPTNGETQSIQPHYRIRRLSVRECFRLMDFDDSFTWPVSDTQAYKQAGNSICVGVLAAIIGRLKL